MPVIENIIVGPISIHITDMAGAIITSTSIRTAIPSATTDMAIQLIRPGMPHWGSTGITGVDGVECDPDARN